jgi:ABC-type ATPase involved in cell division
MAAVAFEHVAKVYSDGTRAVDDLTLEIGDGEFVVSGESPPGVLAGNARLR